MNKTISVSRAIQICNDWHIGQWSAYYQFGSSGEYLIANALRYLKETEDNLHPEYELHPHELTKKQAQELLSLKRFFIYQGNKIGLLFEYHKHPVYGYMIPHLSGEISEDLTKQITPLQYLK